MTLTPQAQARIDDRIRAIAPRRGGTVGRQELRSHVADAAEGLAQGDAARSEHVDAAFTALGSDADIRATFFPARPRAPASRLQVALLALATVLAASAILAENGGRAACSVEGEGSCEAYASGDALDLALWSTPPLLVLAAMFLAPAWAGAVVAAGYLVVTAARLADTVGDSGFSSWELLLPVAAVVTCLVAGRQVLLERRLRSAMHA